MKKESPKPKKSTAQKVIESAEKPKKYFEAVGRRKTAVARVRLFKGDGTMIINDRSVSQYFPIKRHQKSIKAPLTVLNVVENFSSTVRVSGGGPNAQAEAIRHAFARALVRLNPNYRKRLRKNEFLTRDSRMVERKKYGLKKARRAPQWAKR